jgi:hypothetical protein
MRGERREIDFWKPVLYSGEAQVERVTLRIAESRRHNLILKLGPLNVVGI